MDEAAKHLQAVREADALDAMLVTLGWGVMQRELGRAIAEAMQGFRSSRDMQHVAQLQGKVEGLEWAKALPERLAARLRQEAKSDG